jgi:hypothetical protein
MLSGIDDLGESRKEGNLHVRFDEGEATQRKLTTAVG